VAARYNQHGPKTGSTAFSYAIVKKRLKANNRIRMLLLLEFLAELLDLSGSLGAVVLVLWVGLVVSYGMFGGVRIVVLVVGSALMGHLMRPQPFITLALKPGNSTPKEGATRSSETAESVE
jgi:hypothetical protein